MPSTQGVARGRIDVYMRSIAKSLFLAFAGTGVFFSFLMMTVITIQAALARANGDISKLSVVVDPGNFLRSVGVPLAVAVFVVLFGIVMVKSHKGEKHAAVKV